MTFDADVRGSRSRRPFDRVIQIELNEISKPVVERLVARGELPTFAKLLRGWRFVETESETTYENIEPWIQWVTAHTGQEFEEHGIFRLSDAPKLEGRQIWEVLSDAGVESGIVGSMNALRRGTQGGAFFPDPWSKSNDAYPQAFVPLWELISRRVQAHATSSASLSDLVQGVMTCLRYRLPLSLYVRMASQLVRQKLDPKSKWRLAGVFDVFLAEMFFRVLKTTRFGFYTLFLNSVAHYQHHYWRAFAGDGFDPEIRCDDLHADDDPVTYGYRIYDRILGRLFDALAREAKSWTSGRTLVLIASGLSQVPYTASEEQGGMNYYRLRDHATFTADLSLEGVKAYPLMSRDWQVRCDEARVAEVRERLEGLRVGGDALFKVRQNTPGYLFLETAVTRSVRADERIRSAAGEDIGAFSSHFENIAIKSGHHTGTGNLWLSHGEALPAGVDSIRLAGLFDLGLEALGVPEPEQRGSQEREATLAEAV